MEITKFDMFVNKVCHTLGVEDTIANQEKMYHAVMRLMAEMKASKKPTSVLFDENAVRMLEESRQKAASAALVAFVRGLLPPSKL